MQPIIVINFKTYPEATGENAERLAHYCEEIAHKRKADIRVAVQACDVYRVARAVKIPVYAQHIDGVEPSRNTGFLTAASARTAGAVGTLLNHSEHPLDDATLAKTVAAAQAAGLRVIICAATTTDGVRVAKLKPEFVAIEPPELIAGKISVSKAKPELVRNSTQKIAGPVLVGAGVHTGEDVRVALQLGAKGVLLASGVVLAKDQRKALEELLTF